MYHTRFVSSSAYEDRVHQIFVADNGGLVAAPFEYCGETLSEKAYETAKIVGDYQILTMGDVNYSAKECVTEKTITLNEDGTVSGEYTGTWEQGIDGPKLTLICGGITYKGIFVEQDIEGSKWPAMCLTVVGNNDVSIWGYRIADDKLAVVKNAAGFQGGVPANTYGNLELVKALSDNVTVNWESSNPAIISKDGKVVLPEEDTEVTMTAVISRGDAVVKKEFITKVYSKGLEAIDMNAGLEASFSFDDTNMANEKNPSESAELLAKGSASKPVQQEDPDRGTKVLHTYKGNAASQGNRPGGKKEASNSYVRINNPLKGKNASGATVSLWVKCDDTNVWGEIWSFFDDDQTRLFLTQNAYLGYNNGTVFFDCNNGASVTNAIGRGTWKLVTVSVDQNGFGIYIDGVLKYNKQVNVAYAGSSYDEAMGKRLLDLINSSDNFYIGYGGFWGSGELSVDNLKIYSMALGGSEITKLYQEEKDSMDQAVADKAAAEKAAADQAAANKVAVGKTYTAGKLKYKVTSMKNGENYVTVTGVKTKSITSATIKATVKINGTSFKVRQIGSSAFAKCKKLKSLTIGSNVAKIGKKAFYNCSKLQKVTIKSKLITSVGSSALKGVYKKAKLKVPSSKLKKYKKLFKNKGQKKTVKITK